jgi:hypothetical protein
LLSSKVTDWRMALPIVAVIVTAACGLSPNQPHTASSITASAVRAGESLALKPYGAPPNDVPVVLHDRIALKPAQFAWRINGVFRRATPTSDADVAITVIKAKPGTPLEFLVQTSTLPLGVRMLLYGDVPAGTIPSVENAESLDCAKSPDCSVGLVNGTVTVRLTKQPLYPAVVTLFVEYATLNASDMEAGIPAYSASWVARLEP